MQEEELVAYFEVLPRNLEELKETTNQVLWSVSLSNSKSAFPTTRPAIRL